MEPTQIVLMLLLIAASVTIAFKLWVRSRATAEVAEVTREVYPVWAAQGPFETGAQSAVAMRYAYVAVRGSEEAERMAAAIGKHAQSYDADPGTWERLRHDSLKLSGPKTDDYVTIARGLAAADSLNKDLLEGGGHKIELNRQPDGRLTFAYKQIWTDDEIQRKKKTDAEAITKSIGTNLLGDSSVEGRRLLQFLIDLHRANPESGPETPIALGHLWFACLNFAQENPDSDVAKKFTLFNDAHSAKNPKVEP
jgi:hypothetical protein